MPDPDPEALRYTLSMLGELLIQFPDHPALLAAADEMDLPDELWIALRVMTMGAPDRERLRDFLLVHPATGIVRVDGRTLAIVVR